MKVWYVIFQVSVMMKVASLLTWYKIYKLYNNSNLLNNLFPKSLPLPVVLHYLFLGIFVWKVFSYILFGGFCAWLLAVVTSFPVSSIYLR